MTTYLFLYFLVGVVVFIVVNRTLVDDESGVGEVVFLGLMAIFAWPIFIVALIMMSIAWIIFKASQFIRNYKR